jgi:hypothetical protein
LVSISIEFVEDNVHPWFVNTSLDFEDQVKLDIFNKKPPFFIFINSKYVILLLNRESYRWWDVKFVTVVLVIIDFAIHDILVILFVVVLIVQMIAAFELIPQFKENLLL